MTKFAIAFLFLVVGISAAAQAGDYVPPPGDALPRWLGNDALVYVGYDTLHTPPNGEVVKVIDASGSSAPVVMPRSDGYGGQPLPAPSGALLAYNVAIPGAQSIQDWLAVSAPDGSNQHLLAQNGTPIGWQADSSHLFYRVDTRGSSLDFSIRPDGSDLTQFPARAQGAPSPDGVHFAYLDQVDKSVHVVASDGTGEVAIESGGQTAASIPVWSTDGTSLAFWVRHGKGIRLLVADPGHPSRTFMVANALATDSLAWSGDDDTVIAFSGNAMVSIDLAAGSRTIARVPSGAVSPDGARVAFAAVGSCRDRDGIYVEDTDGTHRQRITNSCTITGTAGHDVLHGSYSQIVVGLAGNDTLYADDAAYYFEGDILEGGPGNDRLVGGAAQDTLLGGPGDDVLSGGSSADTIVGGPGHDHIDGGGDGDAIHARDGARDWIVCGTNVHKPDPIDTVYADTIDVVAADCERVHRFR